MPLSALRLFVAVVLIVGFQTFQRLLAIYRSISQPGLNPSIRNSRKRSCHMLIVLGSGGHTTEMFSLLRDLDPTLWAHRTYVVSSGDDFSEGKAHGFERTIQAKHKGLSNDSEEGETDPITGTWDVKTVPRARKIHQPLYTTPFSALWCLVGCLKLLYNTSKISKTEPLGYPDLIMTNGPATAVITILANIILKFLGMAPLWKMKTIYVESWARVKSMSLSGRVLSYLGICDRIVVQWEGLANSVNKKSGRSIVEWRGLLVA